MDNTTTIEEPKGIPFFSVQTRETHWCKLEPTISAYINSSDMGINASRDQNFGWRLAPEWVHKVRAFKRNRQQMSILTAANQGQKPTTVNILYYMYGEELAEYYGQLEDNENPYEEEYLAMIAQGSSRQEAATQTGMPLALADFQAIDEDDLDMADLIDDIATEEDEAPAEPTQPETPAEPAKPEPKPAAPKAADKPATPKKS